MLFQWFALPVCAALLFPVSVLAAPVKVVLAVDEAMVEQAGQWIPARIGMELAVGAVRTSKTGRIQLRMQDGSMIALPPNSEIQLSGAAASTLKLQQGGLRLTTPEPGVYWSVQAMGRNIRASGYLKLQTCADGCALQAGLYGRGHGGETIVEYQGGRSVLKDKAFRLGSTRVRPEILAKPPLLLQEETNHPQAELARLETAKMLTQGIEAFRAGDADTAKAQLEAVQARDLSQAVVSYYLGLIALEKQNNAEALLLLQKYMKEDPQAAVEREVPKTITLLSTQQLQEEVAKAIAQESTLSNAPPEPNSIAVQAFASRGDPLYRALAKGIAAVVIADLSQVPGLKVLEREKVQKLTDEMKLGESGLAEASTAVRTGRLMRAEKVIVGSFGAQ